MFYVYVTSCRVVTHFTKTRPHMKRTFKKRFFILFLYIVVEHAINISIWYVAIKLRLTLYLHVYGKKDGEIKSRKILIWIISFANLSVFSEMIAEFLFFCTYKSSMSTLWGNLCIVLEKQVSSRFIYRKEGGHNNHLEII